MYDLAITKGTVLIKNTWIKTNIYVKDGKIVNIAPTILDAHHFYDASSLHIIPGLIDPHVHFELDLGWIKSVDDFYAGSIQAAYGGVTSFIDFLEPVDSAESLERAYDERMDLAKKSVIDYTFHATIKNPKGSLEDFVLKMKALGLTTLKLFTTYSDSNRRTYDKEIIELIKLSKKHNIMLLAHIENDEMISLDQSFQCADLNLSRPTLSETSEALKLASYVKKYQGFLYMVHLTSGHTIEKLVEHYGDIINKNFFIESCPQYFTFTSDHLKSEHSCLFACAPPLRSLKEQEILKEHFHYVDTIGTDHCAFLKKDKMKAYLHETPLGVGGIESSFQVMHNLFGDQVISKMSSRVANLHRLKNKGEIKIGFDADFAFYKEKPTTITKPHGYCDYSLYEGKKVNIEVIATMVRGHFVYLDRKIIKQQGIRINRGNL
jgi:dihydropyrimidinase